METTFWQTFDQEEVLLIGISNTNNQNIISDFIAQGGLTFPILYDPGSSGGVQGGDTYDLYYMPNDGSPYPRDFIIDQEGLIAYANNEIDTEWMLYVLNDLLGSFDVIVGDINQDDIINILDVVSLINFILDVNIPNEYEQLAADLNEDLNINVLDVVILVNTILSGN